jgi:hypothetical protein
MFSLTDSFTWEELPTRDPETGYVTNAGYIPATQKIAKRVPVLLLTFHLTQSAVRIVTGHDVVFPAWLPVDASLSTIYEIVISVQVTKSVLEPSKYYFVIIYEHKYVSV